MRGEDGVDECLEIWERSASASRGLLGAARAPLCAIDYLHMSQSPRSGELRNSSYALGPAHWRSFLARGLPPRRAGPVSQLPATPLSLVVRRRAKRGVLDARRARVPRSKLLAPRVKRATSRARLRNGRIGLPLPRRAWRSRKRPVAERLELLAEGRRSSPRRAPTVRTVRRHYRFFPRRGCDLVMFRAAASSLPRPSERLRSSLGPGHPRPRTLRFDYSRSTRAKRPGWTPPFPLQSECPRARLEESAPHP